MIFDNAEVPIKCPKCGREIKQTIAWLKSNDRMKCDGCGVEIAFEKSQFTGPMKEIDESWNKLTDTLKRFGR